MPFEGEPKSEPVAEPVAELDNNSELDGTSGGRRRRSSGSRKNSWLSHVKATMKVHRDKSFKQVLKIAKKTYKKSQSQSQSAGKRRKAKRGGSSSQKQRGGSGMAGKTPFGENAAPVS
jgi:hypothetical protein